jgi:hypothetical protein
MSASYDSRKYVLRDLQGNEIPATFRVTTAEVSYADPEEGLPESDQKVMTVNKTTGEMILNFPAPLQKNNIIIEVTPIDASISVFFRIVPILCITNTYENDLLNSWSGETIVDKENNYIMSSLVGAGEKDKSTNTFSGVLMGKVGSKNNSGTFGLYGYNKGT